MTEMGEKAAEGNPDPHRETAPQYSAQTRPIRQLGRAASAANTKNTPSAHAAPLARKFRGLGISVTVSMGGAVLVSSFLDEDSTSTITLNLENDNPRNGATAFAPPAASAALALLGNEPTGLAAQRLWTVKTPWAPSRRAERVCPSWGTAEACLEARMNSYTSQPINFDQLVSTLADSLGCPSETQALSSKNAVPKDFETAPVRERNAVDPK